jgi:hypothetical protein
MDKRTMIEEGVEEPYTEVWERVDDGASTGGQAFVMRMKSEREKGLLVAVGEHFILAMDGGKSGDVEISHGIRRGPIGGWIVDESTLRGREGCAVFGDAKPVVRWEEREVIESRAWEIVEPASGLD